MEIKNAYGITLIALIITIIIMLILSGVVLTLTIGENGLFETAKYAVKKNSEETAREKLELALADLTSHKYTNEAYNENEYVDNYLEDRDIKVCGNTATVDGWRFEIDRKELKIGKSLGKEKAKITKEVKKYIGKNENNKYQVNILVTIESDKEIENIVFRNSDEIILEIIPTEVKNKISKDMTIELDKEYTVTVKTNDGEIETLAIIEKSVERIKTVEELTAFRDKVNTGLTYEGKTINVVADLDLSNVCGKNINGKEVSWEPIGNYGTDTTHVFKGRFNGNGHRINNIYINTASNYQGLFGYVENGTITGVIIGEIQDEENTESTSKIVSIKGGSFVGAVVGSVNYGTIQNCGNNVDINASGTYIGGIVGLSKNAEIIGTYNKGEVIGASHSVGGIVGDSYQDKMKFNYNMGNIKAHYIIGGIAGSAYYGEVKYCYNMGEISNNGAYQACVHEGGICGAFDGSIAEYCYNLGSIVNTGGGSRVGGISGICTSYGTGIATTMTHCFNRGTIDTNGGVLGGLCGLLDSYCTISDSHVLAGISVGGFQTIAGSPNGIIGQWSGYTATISISESLPTVYNVVNGLNDGDSEYWSKTIYSNSDLQTPKLKWEN